MPMELEDELAQLRDQQISDETTDTECYRTCRAKL
jgi:hypothetical protein